MKHHASWQETIMKDLNMGILAQDQCSWGSPPVERKKLIADRVNNQVVSKTKTTKLRRWKGLWDHAWLSKKEPIKEDKQSG